MQNRTEWFDAGSCVGRAQAFALIATKCSAAQAQCLKQTKEEKLHEKLGVKWEDFCSQQFGVSRATADRVIAQFDEFGEAYFKLSSLARISPETYRQIAPTVTSETIEIDGAPVLLVESNAPKIRAHITSLRGQLRSAIDNRDPVFQEFERRFNKLVADLMYYARIVDPGDPRDALLHIAAAGLRKFEEVAMDLRDFGHYRG